MEQTVTQPKIAPMMNWYELQRYINLHSLPYLIIRYGDQLRDGQLIDTFTGGTVATNLADAEKYLREI